MQVVDARRLVVGTAQLGLDYGVANTAGQPARKEAFGILDMIWNAGVRAFDTAAAYGDSEKVLGEFLSTRGVSEDAEVITKLPPETSVDNLGDLKDKLRSARERVGCSCFYGLMLHREALLDEWERVWKALEPFKQSGRLGRLGVSVYTPDGALKGLSLDGIDMIQVPANVFDQRFRRAGVFDLAKKKGVDVYIRSVYLQGLFFATAESFRHREDRLSFLDKERALYWIDRLNEMAAELDMTPDIMALAYVREAYPEARVLLGMESRTQAEANLAAWAAPVPEDMVAALEERFAEVEDEIVHPPYWRRGVLC